MALKTNDRLLVVVFLRGGCDVLNFLTPLEGEDRKIYESERPNLSTPVTGDGALLKLTDQFGLHPSATQLQGFYNAGHLAIVPAVGLPFDSRSHFDVQNAMDLGLAGKRNIGSGWLTRYLEQYKNEGDFTAMSVSPLTNMSLLGFDKAVQFNDPKRLNLLGDKNLAGLQMSALNEFYNVEFNSVSESARHVLRLLDKFASKNDDYQPAAGVDYPKNDLGNKLKTLAQVLKMGMMMSAATVDMGGWDTHKNQGSGINGTFAKQVEQLSQSLHAFYTDMQTTDIGKKTTVVVMTEFGRRLRQNANGGTDHGHGGMMMVLGPQVSGGKIFGHWPGLKTEQLYDRADLAVTTDYRQVLHEVLEGADRATVDKSIFPDFNAGARLGLFAASAKKS